MNTLYYGRCHGGPLNDKNRAHYSEVHRLAFSKSTGKAIPALQSSSDPDIEFGEYLWADGVWVWKTS
ncbi:hypothetical protein I6F35_28040 [Bradyrhizobium sp. BRP22]|uniref:hypothetical protein n=1 Tax=Bradyrhizobium sp. BRP22 TaxID=2793821 RepID=UPI001CD46C51|nr:hypothetical protein [Bradyrhizobium sp. BRP22]MCA1457025.1 hypothetical protein [Bradyrhizobium sp. BRP22]